MDGPTLGYPLSSIGSLAGSVRLPWVGRQVRLMLGFEGRLSLPLELGFVVIKVMTNPNPLNASS